MKRLLHYLNRCLDLVFLAAIFAVIYWNVKA